MRNKLIGSVCLVLGICVIVTTGTTFAYFNSSANENNDTIKGTIEDFDVELKIEEIYTSNQLIPLDDSKINTAINNECIDSKGYQVCTLYKITLTNNGNPIILNGHIKSTEETTYTTDNLRAQLFNSNLTSSVSDKLILTNTTEEKYFKLDETNLFAAEVNNENTYYLAIWLTETGDYQYDDYSKIYSGQVAFESISGQIITANFSA